MLEKEFFDFIYARQLIWYKRFSLNENPPWTSDVILATYKIINVYRELDKCTIYIINKLRQIEEREKILINVIFYRFFNRFNLYEELEIEPFEKIDSQLNNIIRNKFEELKNKGNPIFNNAYLISGVKGEKKHISILNNLQKLNIKEILVEIDNTKEPEESFEILKRIPMVGDFLACEIWTDLTYFNFFKQRWNDNDFVNIGPGAKWGLDLIYGKLNKIKQKEMLKHLYEIQKDYLKENWQKIAYKNAYSNYPFLSITNIEQSLCEFRKYWNIKNGKGRRKYFKANIY